ncbi:MAG: hypothetical protein RMJ67_09205, partial [Elusimicrobiota bacterium]|nr:hypothetical protein [Endomicrobiia bacterium]MDW8166673.1 hypothetical protein [Elusimicrobiota bacterium]
MKEILKFNKKGIDYCVFLTDKGEFYLKTQYGGGIIDINLKITKYREEVQYIKKFGRTLKVSRKIPLETAYCLSIGEGDFPQLKEALGLNPQNKLNVIIPDAIQKQIPKILEMQTNARKEFIKSQKEKLLDQGIEIAFVQEVCRYDGDVFVTDSYTLNPEDEEELRKFDFTDKEINQIYRYCRDKGLFSEDKVFVGVGNYGNNVYATIKKVLLNKEIYENAKYYITEGELPKIKGEIKSIKDKLANEIEIL